MNRPNPYLHLISLGFIVTKGARNVPVKLDGKIVKLDGKTLYAGGAGEVFVCTLGSLEVMVEHDRGGNHLVQLHDVKSGETSGKAPYRTVKALKLLEKQVNGENVWEYFQNF